MTNPDNDIRPTPEAMLKLAQAEENQAEQQGKLKVFLGYAAGVGKTYAMLEAARKRKADGRDLVVGYVESHGRSETDALLEGLELVPRMQLSYAGVTLPEMDLDAILARKPQIVLVDELAHSNVPGSRHEKRWQDVEELLAAGTDVYTTVNIQHFESLNDVVAQITGITVRETVPDRLLDIAFEIKLIDLPPEDLLQRLHEGKVYIPDQATKAIEKFFRPGNLMALRELSLRRTAARVDDQMRAYMETQSITGPWPTAERLLVCVSGSPFSEQLIRATRRLADELKAPWHTVYIETPGSDRHTRENRERVWQDLRFAEGLGAQVATITATSVPEAVAEYAARHNVTRIVVGKPTHSRWYEMLHPSIVDQIIRRSSSSDVFVVRINTGGATPQPQKDGVRGHHLHPWGYSLAGGLVAVATICCWLVSRFLEPTNLVMIYLLAVVVAAVRLGRRPAMLTAFLGVLAFDFFFVPPHLTFAVADTQYLITFVGLFTVGIVISNLVARSRERADVIRVRELQTAALYYLTRDLAASADITSVMQAVISNVEEALHAKAAIFLAEGEHLDLLEHSTELAFDPKEQAVADWAFRNRHMAGRGTDTLVSANLIYLPLHTTTSQLGVLAVQMEDELEYRSTESRRLLDAFAIQAAMAIERVQFSRQAEQAQILQARENLERALLNSISHDLRTPLVSVKGALSTLKDKSAQLSASHRAELMETACAEAERLNRFVGNLLDMTRIEAGALRPHREPVEIQDLIGCALNALEQRLGKRTLELSVPAGTPPVTIDLVLMTQVLVNLLDNALKYTPAEKPIAITAHTAPPWLILEVNDHGPGIPEQDLKRVFDKFYRIPVPEGAGGTGLGLSICKGIVEAHHGRIKALNREGGGLKIVIELPLESSNNVH